MSKKLLSGLKEACSGIDQDGAIYHIKFFSTFEITCFPFADHFVEFLSESAQK